MALKIPCKYDAMSLMQIRGMGARLELCILSKYYIANINAVKRRQIANFKHTILTFCLDAFYPYRTCVK